MATVTNPLTARRASCCPVADMMRLLGAMEQTATQTKHLETRTADILRRITRALPDWSPERLHAQARSMALLEMKFDARAAFLLGLGLG